MRINYKSTRGNNGSIASSAAIIRGIAEDGGLYVPDCIPRLGEHFDKMTDSNYSDTALYILRSCLTDFTEEELSDCVGKAYDSKFGDDEVTPLRGFGNLFFLELYHGPTLAFKDVALSILPHLLKLSLKKQEVTKEVVILAATSGDTGVSALEGFSGIEGVRTIVFYPERGISEIQRKQMVTHRGKNVHVAGIEGNFDDAQKGVKSIFNDEEYRELLDNNNYILSSANSINVGRLIPQIAYYVHAYHAMLKRKWVKPGEKVNIAVPTGNFGNILAAYYAKRMGLPVNKLICASNENNVLYDYMRTGIYNRYRYFRNTCSPSMDILVSSNLERLNYYLSGEDEETVRCLMKKLDAFGRYEITQSMKEGLKDFYGGFATDNEILEVIGKGYDELGYVMDTHTAAAYSVYRQYKADTDDGTKTIIAATASPYKFPGSVCRGLGLDTEGLDDFQLMEQLSLYTGMEIPQVVKGLKDREQVHRTVCDKAEMKNEVSRFLKV